MDALYDVIVLGAGPAGLSAALYTARAKMKTLVVTGSMVGGQIAFTYQVDNYPGFSEGVTGPDLSNKFKAHAERFGAELIEKDASAVDFSIFPYRITVDGEIVEARSVILATGMNHRKLGVPGEDRLLGRGVFVCATCDAALYEDRKVVVVGGGDSAVQEALDLAQYASEVTIVHRREETRACRCLMDTAEGNPKIRFLYNATVTEILGEKRVHQICLKDLKTGESRIIDADGVLIAIGWDPNTDIFRGQLDMDETGNLKVDGVKTGKPGIFAAGDLIDTKYRQVVTSCGNGCAAALEAIHWLEQRRGGHSS
jgi:thioredoxin reductase (NADPH)